MSNNKTSEVFEIDTRATCLLCFTNCGLEIDESTDSNFFIQRQTSFRMLLRYLKIDVLKLGPFASSFGTFLGDGSVSANARLEVLLCDNCSKVTTEFLDLFQIFDEARLRLDETCGLLLKRIREGEGDQGRLEEYRKSLENVSHKSNKPLEALLNASLAESLRNETKRKCSERLSKSLPKVALSGGDSCKRRKIDSFTISKENENTSGIKISQSFVDSENLGKGTDLQLIADKSCQCIQEVAQVEVLDTLPVENYIDSVETDVDASDTLNQMEAEVKSPPQMGPPIEEELVTPSPPIIDLTLSPERSERLDNSSSTASPSSKKIESFSISTENEFATENISDPTESSDLVDEIIFELAQSNSTEVVRVGQGDLGDPLAESMGTGEITLLPERPPPEPVLLSHSSKECHSCDHCEKVYKSPRDLQHHLILVHPLNKYAARFPSNTTTFQVMAAVNLIAFGETRIPVKTDNGKYMCPLCSHKFLRTALLRVHIFNGHFERIISVVKESHSSKSKIIFVDNNATGSIHYDEELIVLDDFQDEPEQVMDDPLNNDPDPIMDKPASSSPSLQMKRPLPALNPMPSTSTVTVAAARVPTTSALPTKFPCLICNKVCSSSDNLLKHNKLSHPIFRCGQCLKNFESDHLLTTHMMSAHTMKFFRTQLPPATSAADLEDGINSLVRTRRDLSGGIGEDVVIGCGICADKYFLLSQKFQLRMHILEVHINMVKSTIHRKRLGAKDPAKKIRPQFFMCSQCRSMFKSRDLLDTHLLSAHTR